jgi:hypothetical protein
MTTEATTTEVENRVPEVLTSQAIFVEFLGKILEAYDEISKYNEKVLGNKDSEWTSYKILDKARELGRPEKGEPNASVKEALSAWEALVTEVNKAKQNVIQVTAKELGIDFAAGNERDEAIEAPLKEKRKVAINIGEQLKAIAGLSADPEVTTALQGFLEKYEMPAVGSNRTHSFAADGNATAPKYRVKVSVSKEDELLFEADGFTKAALGLPKYYERGQAPGAAKLREAWEKAGNSIQETKVNPVEFVDNGLTFTITKK